MRQFSRIETTIAKIFNHFPGIKRIIKRIYQILNFFIFRKKVNFNCKYPVLPVEESDEESFFGYYDKSPESPDGNYIIYQRVSLRTTKKPRKDYFVELILKDNLSGQAFAAGKSFSYNWQQGTKLQWLSGNNFIYNFYDAESKRYQSRIIDAANPDKKTEIPYPVYDCYGNEYALSLNFDRLAAFRPDYGYRNKNTITGLDNLGNDGIFYIDLNKKTCRLLISLELLKSIKPLASMKNAKHKVNHIMISPNGKRFIFLHRWMIPGGKKYDRLLSANKDGSDLKIISDNEMVSHYCWLGNNEIVGYLRHNSYGDAFYRINIRTNEIKPLSRKLLQLGDGHPSVMSAKMLFDSYPDRSRMKKLYLYNLETDILDQIGEFFEPLNYYEETRCDLHPKWGKNGKNIFIDSTHTGKRKLYKIQLTHST